MWESAFFLSRTLFTGRLLRFGSELGSFPLSSEVFRIAVFPSAFPIASLFSRFSRGVVRGRRKQRCADYRFSRFLFRFFRRITLPDCIRFCAQSGGFSTSVVVGGVCCDM